MQKQFENAQQLSNDDPQVSASAHRVRAMLTLHLIGKLQSEELIARLHHPDEHVRAWAVRLLTEALPLDAALGPVNMDARRAKQIYVASSALLDHLTEIARAYNVEYVPAPCCFPSWPSGTSASNQEHH